MHIRDLYAIIVTDKWVCCRDFYVRWLGFRVVFEASWVADAAAECKRPSRGGVALAHPLRDEPGGQRRFGLYDPARTWVDIVQQIDPAPGFWDRYLP